MSWDSFENDNIGVVVTRDNYVEFEEACFEHGFRFKNSGVIYYIFDGHALETEMYIRCRHEKFLSCGTMDISDEFCTRTISFEEFMGENYALQNTAQCSEQDLFSILGFDQ